MWTTENRRRYDRDERRYPSDLTAAEWRHVKPLIVPAKRGGGKRTVAMREVVNGCDVRAEYRLPVALDPEGPAAAEHRERLLLSVGLGWHAGGDASRAEYEMP